MTKVQNILDNIIYYQIFIPYNYIMNYINIILLQDSDYSKILIDFQRFR